MRHRRTLVAAIGAAAVAVAACDRGDGPVGPIDQLPRPLSAAEAEIVRAGNAFTFALLRERSREIPGENVFLSPLSASMALGMATNGALGETRDEMVATLGFGVLEMPEVNAAYRDLIALLRGLDSRVEMEIANSVWTHLGYPIEPAFLQTAQTYFDARAEELDFSDPTSVRVINDWVKQATSGHITDLLEEGARDEIAFLVNAIYFKSSWTTQFDPRRTQDAGFRNQDGSLSTVRMMRADDMPVRFRRGSGYVAGELPYSRDAYAMTIVIPDEGVDLDDFVATLDVGAWDAITAGMSEQKLMVNLPRFRLEHEAELNGALHALGMRRAFVRHQADFTALSPRALGDELHITEVLQKAIVEVTEEGTVAAAATSVGIGVESAPPSLVVDRPFVFAIRERLSGTILFIGKVGSLTSF
jgi:serine protease inhibitor